MNIFRNISILPNILIEYIGKAMLALNNRPRKCLQWRIPYEVYFEEVLHLV